MVMGLAGNAILPLIYGYFVDLSSARQAYWVLFPCYLFLIFYAFYGYRLKKWSKNKSIAINQESQAVKI